MVTPEKSLLQIAGEWSAVIQAISAIVGIVLTILLAVLAHRTSKEQERGRIAEKGESDRRSAEALTQQRLGLEHSIRNGWIAIDLAVVRNKDLLPLADNLFHPHVTGAGKPSAKANADGLDPARKRWLAYAAFNLVISRYNAAHVIASGNQSKPTKDEVKEACVDLLKRLVRDDDIYEVVVSGSYEPWFTELCKELRTAESLKT